MPGTALSSHFIPEIDNLQGGSLAPTLNSFMTFLWATKKNFLSTQGDTRQLLEKEALLKKHFY